MTQYRLRTVVIDAMRLDNTNAREIVEWIKDNDGDAFMRNGPIGNSFRATVHVKTSTFWDVAEVGDYVICGPARNYWTCEPDTFTTSYQEIEP